MNLSQKLPPLFIFNWLFLLHVWSGAGKTRSMPSLYRKKCSHSIQLLNICTWGWSWCRSLTSVKVRPRWYWSPRSEHGFWWSIKITRSLVTQIKTQQVAHHTCRSSDIHLLQLLWCVQHSADYHDSVQKVQGNPVWWADVFCSPDVQQRTVHICSKKKKKISLHNINVSIPNLIKQFPLLEANTTMGAMVLSSARWR